MKILVYGINYSPELTGIGKYTGEFVDWLVAQGHTCKVIAAHPYYPEWKVAPGYNGKKYSTEKKSNLTVHRCPLYVPKKLTGKTRILHLLSFVVSSSVKLFTQFRWKPDVIICIAPAFKCAPSALLAGKLFGAKTVLHIQDFEIDAMIGLCMLGKRKVILWFAYKLESLIMRSFDRVSTISYSMCARLHEKGVAKSSAVIFPNWVDTDVMTPVENKERYRKMWWGIGNDEIIILYSGNIGRKQGLELVLEAAYKLRHEKKLRFVFVGAGNDKANLLDKAKELNVSNVSFHDLQPVEDLPDLLRFADIHLVIQRKGAADAVFPSKVTGIFSVGGHAIVTAEPHTELGRVLIDNPDVATLIPPESVNDLVVAIKCLAEGIDPLNRQHNKFARQYAEIIFNKERVLEKFERSLVDLVGEGKLSSNKSGKEKLPKFNN